MPTKDVECFGYLPINVQILFDVPGGWLEFNSFNGFISLGGQYPNGTRIQSKNSTPWARHTQTIDSAKVEGFFNNTGIFKLRAYYNNDKLAEEWIEINALTGSTGGGSMKTVLNQRAHVGTERFSDVILCYSFYDAGNGFASNFGLPDKHQCTVTVARNRSKWMGVVAPPGSEAAQKGFWRFVLPSAHNFGLNSMETCEALFSTLPKVLMYSAIIAMTAGLGLPVGIGTGAGVTTNFVDYLRVTSSNQKETLQTMLAIGARFFEFRAGRVNKLFISQSKLEDKIYFHHKVVPGMGFDHFLSDVIDFLMKNKDEIVVVVVEWVNDTPPEPQTIKTLIEQALSKTNEEIQWGTRNDMKTLTVDQIRQQKKRLILFYTDELHKYDKYDSDRHATTNGDSIIQEFETMTTEEQGTNDLTYLQCQATLTNSPLADAYAVPTLIPLLLANKGIIDQKTLSWVKDHALERLKGASLMVIMNDFFDGATAETAIELSTQRFLAFDTTV